MLKFVLAFVGVMGWVQAGTPLLTDTAESFENVVCNSYVISHMGPDMPVISDELRRAIEGVSRTFSKCRYDELNEFNNLVGSLSKTNCHIVTAMLGVLLKSGVKELVELYYFFVESYKSNPQFLDSMTGYKWGAYQGNKFERAVYEAGNKMWGMTEALLGKGNSSITGVQWVNKRDGWRVHQAWSEALMNQIFEEITEEDVTYFLRVFKGCSPGRYKNALQELGGAELRTETSSLLQKVAEELQNRVFDDDCFLAGVLSEPLWDYFRKIFPQKAISLLPHRENVSRLQRDEELRAGLWKDVWSCDNAWFAQYFHDSACQNRILFGLESVGGVNRGAFLKGLEDKNRELAIKAKEVAFKCFMKRRMERENQNIDVLLLSPGVLTDSQKREVTDARIRVDILCGFHDQPLLLEDDPDGSCALGIVDHLVKVGLNIQALWDLCHYRFDPNTGYPCPLSRAEVLSLKAQIKEHERLKDINDFVSDIVVGVPGQIKTLLGQIGNQEGAPNPDQLEIEKLRREIERLEWMENVCLPVFLVEGDEDNAGAKKFIKNIYEVIKYYSDCCVQCDLCQLCNKRNDQGNPRALTRAEVSKLETFLKGTNQIQEMVRAIVEPSQTRLRALTAEISKLNSEVRSMENPSTPQSKEEKVLSSTIRSLKNQISSANKEFEQIRRCVRLEAPRFVLIEGDHDGSMAIKFAQSLINSFVADEGHWAVIYFDKKIMGKRDPKAGTSQLWTVEDISEFNCFLNGLEYLSKLKKDDERGGDVCWDKVSEEINDRERSYNLLEKMLSRNVNIGLLNETFKFCKDWYQVEGGQLAFRKGLSSLETKAFNNHLHR